MEQLAYHGSYLPSIAIVLSGVNYAFPVGSWLSQLPVDMVQCGSIQPVESLSISVILAEPNPLFGVMGEPERQGQKIYTDKRDHQISADANYC